MFDEIMGEHLQFVVLGMGEALQQHVHLGLLAVSGQDGLPQRDEPVPGPPHLRRGGPVPDALAV